MTGRPDRVQELSSARAALGSAPDDPAARLRYAQALDALGRTVEARDAFIDVLRVDPAARDALLALGTLLFHAGYRSAARLTYRELLKHHPNDVMGLVNLGNLEFDDGHLAEARPLYENAVRLDPGAALAHQGLSYVLARNGERERAAHHREIGFRLAPTIVVPFRGAGTPIRVLLLLSPARGNIATDRILDDTTFLTTKAFAEFLDPALPLPPHDVAFNAIGDVETSSSALAAARAVLAGARATINPPERVLRTSRVDIARRLRGVDGVVVPRIRCVARDEVAAIDLPRPFLLRSPGYHTGEFFEMVGPSDDAAAVAASLPGDELLAIEFLDARGTDGAARKYRVLFIDGQAYPLHLARSSHWKVHYYSADLVCRADAIEEEARFLRDMPSVLGTRGMAALEAIRDELDLDYVGVDFALDANGRILIFEANATMKVVPPLASDENVARREAAGAAIAATRQLVIDRAEGTSG